MILKTWGVIITLVVCLTAVVSTRLARIETHATSTVLNEEIFGDDLASLLTMDDLFMRFSRSRLTQSMLSFFKFL